MPDIWCLGYHRIGTLRGFLPDAFGHFGFGGSGAWADPSKELSVAMIANTGRALLDSRILRIGAAAVKAADAQARAY
jgi:CubicO group peptidase (beta-lactamase class C family)